MRVLGLDFGDKTLGVAISDPMGWTARGLEVVRRPNPQDVAATVARVKALAEEYGADEIVLGDPKGLDGGGGSRAAQNAAFKRKLEAALGRPVKLWDERFTTVAAERVLLAAGLSHERRDDIIDRQAAVCMLQGYLDAEYNKRNINQNRRKRVMVLDEHDDFDPADEDDLETIIMTGEEGEEVEYLILDEVEHKGAKYILVVEADNVDDDEADAVIFKQVEESDDEYTYEQPTDEEFEEVAKLLQERLDEYEIDCE